MPKMDWELFQRDHYRPHLLIVVANSERNVAAKQADFERLAIKLEASGNYAFKTEGDSIYAAFENETDASRFSVLFRPKRTTRELDWSSSRLRGWIAPSAEESRQSSKAVAASSADDS